MAAPIIAVQNLSKKYRLYARPSDRLREVISPWKRRHSLFNALDNVSFEVHKGQHLGIIGVNGAGKSTLLQILAGVLTPSSGSVEVNGRVAALLELGAGFNPELTGRENITFLASILGVEKDRTPHFFEDIINFAELREFIDQPVKIYSSGMFARLAFAMNIASLPDILIVDEALAVGDASFQQKCLRRMKNYRERGTIIFVSHDTASVMNLCERALWLEQGQVKEYGLSKDVCERYIASAYKQFFATQESIQIAVQELTPPTPQKQDSLPSAAQGSIQRRIGELTTSQRSDFADKDSFGDGDATILRCTIENLTHHDTAHFAPNDICRLTMYFHCKKDILSLIAGFFLKNRLGQAIFGTNSYRYGARWTCKGDAIYAATFEFALPDLASAEYLLSISIAEGTLQTHRQLHWIHDAATIQFITSTNDGTVVAAKCSKCIITGRYNEEV